MAHPLPIGLVHKRDIEFGVLLTHMVLDLLPKIPDDKNEIPNTGLTQLIDDDTQDGFTGQRDQRFGLGVTVGAELGAGPGNGNNGFHTVGNDQN
jgi:hypothetical protein